MSDMESQFLDVFGVVLHLRGSAAVCTAVPTYVPGARRIDADAGDLTYDITTRTHGSDLLGYEVWRSDGSLMTRARDPEIVARNLSNELHFEIASRSVDYVFVHAGVVGWNDRAIVMPGRSMSGKTTLVAALLDLGATYYSDEYAVFDADGAIHPYARPLRIRSTDGATRTALASEFTARVGTAPIPLGAMAVLRFEQGATLDVEPITAGTAALALIDNTVRARDAPASSVRAARAAGGALRIKGTRGEADEAARLLLRLAGGRAAPG